MFSNDANNIKSSNINLSSLEDLKTLNFNNPESSTLHISWRINRMTPARYLRKLFPRPDFISEWSGQSIERFIMIDGPKSTGYSLPSFECSYTFIIQGSGERTIILKPSKECGHSCRTVSVVLKPSYTCKSF